MKINNSLLTSIDYSFINYIFLQFKLSCFHIVLLIDSLSQKKWFLSETQWFLIYILLPHSIINLQYITFKRYNPCGAKHNGYYNHNNKNHYIHLIETAFFFGKGTINLRGKGEVYEPDDEPGEREEDAAIIGENGFFAGTHNIGNAVTKKQDGKPGFGHEDGIELAIDENKDGISGKEQHDESEDEFGDAQKYVDGKDVLIEKYNREDEGDEAI